MLRPRRAALTRRGHRPAGPRTDRDPLHFDWLTIALTASRQQHGAPPFSSSLQLFFDHIQNIQTMVYLLEPNSKAARAEDGDHGHGHEDPPPPPPSEAPSQKRRWSQARHPAPLRRQPTITWPSHIDYEPPHPPLPPSQKCATHLPPRSPPY